MFGNRTLSKARASLVKATGLAPGNRTYRRELFSFLVETDQSRAALDQADAVLHTIPESDPDFASMQFKIRQERDFRKSASNRLGAIFLFIPRRLVGIVDLPVAGAQAPSPASSNTLAIDPDSP